MSTLAAFEKVIQRANGVSNFGFDQTIVSQICLADKEFVVTSCKAQDVSSKAKVKIMDILRDNMRNMYEKSGWGWKEVEKRKEVFHKMSRLIYLGENDNPLEPVAFVVFRFVWDDDDEPEYPVLYCYELQVDQSMQKIGAGLALMRMLQNIAAAYDMKKVSLTVFKNNTAAIAFYKKAGFIVDSESPSQYGEDECYEILSDRNYTASTEQAFTRC
jgi:ribosomal protein S18 acetylase RimI-like enzyme